MEKNILASNIRVIENASSIKITNGDKDSLIKNFLQFTTYAKDPFVFFNSFASVR